MSCVGLPLASLLIDAFDNRADTYQHDVTDMMQAWGSAGKEPDLLTSEELDALVPADLQYRCLLLVNPPALI
jgi:hypothetical protein